jgi:hypothetical protein
MRAIEATVLIDAPPSAVWHVLTSTNRYAEWNPFITDVSGTFSMGSRPRLRMCPPGRRPMTFRPKVTEAAEEACLRWTGRLGVRGLCDADHHFTLSQTSTGGTELVQRETFRGLLVPLLASMLPATLQGFETMNAALRDRAEALKPA